MIRHSLFIFYCFMLVGCTTQPSYQSTKPAKASCGIYLPNTPYVACATQEQPKTKQPLSNYKPTPKPQVKHKTQSSVDKPTVVKRAKGFSCEGKSTCGEMNSCAEARFYLSSCGVRKLDKDDDGIPCESICN